MSEAAIVERLKSHCSGYSVRDTSHSANPIRNYGPLWISADLPLALKRGHSTGSNTVHLRKTSFQNCDTLWHREIDASVERDSLKQIIYTHKSCAHLHRFFFSIDDHFADFRLDIEQNEILYQTNSRDGAIALIEGLVLGGFLRLKGLSALHASVLVRDGRAIAISGPSGAGKSSLTWTLMQTGYRLLSDDQLLFDDASENILAYPGRLRLRLNRSAAAAFKIDSHHINPVFDLDRMDKVAIFDEELTHQNATPLDTILTLNPRDDGVEKPVVNWITGPEKFSVLMRQVYSPAQPKDAAKILECNRFMRLAHGVRLAYVTMPDHFHELPAHAQTLMECVRGPS